MAEVDYHRLDGETLTEWLARLEGIDRNALEPVQQQTLKAARAAALEAVRREAAGNGPAT